MLRKKDLDIKKITSKVDKIGSKLGTSFEGKEDLTMKLDAIVQKVEINKTVVVLDSLVKDLKEMNIGNSDDQTEKIERGDVETLLLECRSLIDIVAKFPRV